MENMMGMSPYEVLKNTVENIKNKSMFSHLSDEELFMTYDRTKGTASGEAALVQITVRRALAQVQEVEKSST